MTIYTRFGAEVRLIEAKRDPETEFRIRAVFAATGEMLADGEWLMPIDFKAPKGIMDIYAECEKLIEA